MEVWKSPRKIEEEHLTAIEAERQRQFKLFDDLADLVEKGELTLEQLKSIVQIPEEKLWIPEDLR